MYERLQRVEFPYQAEADISDSSDTTNYTFKARQPMVVYGFGGVNVTETVGTVVTGGVVSLSHGTTEKSTIQAVTGDTVGTERNGTAFPPFKVAAGETLVFKTKTQASGIAGEIKCHIFAEVFPALEGG